ncbi:MAG: DUF4423 domain-containing protein, partial [Deltaproteobacteria bacterium]|nr:DUF4423 domain-containing protein [Deltaproteobacteria bacterium]
LDNDPAEDRELSAATIAIDPVNIPKARMAMKRFRRELCRVLGKGKKQRVYTVSLQCFPAEMNFDQKERT